MTGGYAVEMNSLEREILWNGYEDRTGLWDAFFVVRDEKPGARSASEARELTRQLIESFVDLGWVEIYSSRGPVGEAVFTRVPKEEQAEVFASDHSWTWEDGDPLVWYQTTDEGLEAYQGATSPSS